MVELSVRALAGRLALASIPLLAGGCLATATLEQGDPALELREHLEDLRSSDPENPPPRDDGGPGSPLSILAFRHPAHVPTLVAAAAVAHEAGHDLRAQKLLDQALRRDPGHVTATLLRARVACEEGNLSLARRKLEESLVLHPDEPALHEALAGVLYLLGRLPEARAGLELARELRGDEEPSWSISYHLGLVAEAEGDTGQALAHYRRALELAPDQDSARARERWLSALPGR